jgi:hypothetical protein
MCWFAKQMKNMDLLPHCQILANLPLGTVAAAPHPKK